MSLPNPNPLDGTAQLKDELATVDLGFSEKRLNHVIELATVREQHDLLVRQICALSWIDRNHRACMNFHESVRRLKINPATA